MNDLVRRVEAGIEKQGFGRLMGFKVEEAEPGRVVISVEKREDLLQQTGTLHGGVIGALCEASAGYAALTMLPENQSIIAVEYKLNFLRAVTSDKCIAVGKVLKMGRQLAVIEVEAFNEGSDKVVAKMILTGIPTVTE